IMVQSSSVNLPHFSRKRPPNCFHLPSILSQFIVGLPSASHMMLRRRRIENREECSTVRGSTCNADRQNCGRRQGEHLCYARRIGQPRKCLVSFGDGGGVEHVAEVTAESLYEAGALALQCDGLVGRL